MDVFRMYKTERDRVLVAVSALVYDDWKTDEDKDTLKTGIMSEFDHLIETIGELSEELAKERKYSRFLKDTLSD